MKKILLGTTMFGLLGMLSPLSHASSSVLLMDGAPIAVGVARVKSHSNTNNNRDIGGGGTDVPVETVTFTMDLTDSADPSYYTLVQNAAAGFVTPIGQPGAPTVAAGSDSQGTPAATHTFAISQLDDKNQPYLQYDLTNSEIVGVYLRKKLPGKMKSGTLTLRVSADSIQVIAMNEPHWVPPLAFVAAMNEPHWVPPVYFVGFQGVPNNACSAQPAPAASLTVSTQQNAALSSVR